jgi:hypothetical protein
MGAWNGGGTSVAAKAAAAAVALPAAACGAEAPCAAYCRVFSGFLETL